MVYGIGSWAAQGARAGRAAGARGARARAARAARCARAASASGAAPALPAPAPAPPTTSCSVTMRRYKFYTRREQSAITNNIFLIQTARLILLVLQLTLKLKNYTTNATYLAHLIYICWFSCSFNIYTV